MPTEVFTHKPAQRSDFQPLLSGMVQASLNQLGAQTSSSYSGWDAGVCEDDDFACHDVIERSQMSIDGEFEALCFLIMGYQDVFVFHGFIFIPTGTLKLSGSPVFEGNNAELFGCKNSLLSFDSVETQPRCARPGMDSQCWGEFSEE